MIPGSYSNQTVEKHKRPPLPWHDTRQIAETNERLRRAEKLEAMQSSWDTYTKCDPRPDAASEKALNTFLSQGADEEVTMAAS